MAAAVQPSLIDRVQDRDGKHIYRHDTAPLPRLQWRLTGDLRRRRDSSTSLKQVMDPRTAFQIVHIDGRRHPARHRGQPRAGNRPLAGKTGTTNGAKDVWFIGCTQDLVAGVYMGYDEPRKLGRQSETGGGVAAPIWKIISASTRARRRHRLQHPAGHPHGARRLVGNACMAAAPGNDRQRSGKPSSRTRSRAA